MTFPQQKVLRRSLSLSALLLLAVYAIGAQGQSPNQNSAPARAVPQAVPRVHVIPSGDAIRVDLDGEWFTTYQFADLSRPILYPLIADGGAYMTRRWPQEEYPNEEHDHPHHRSFWYSHGEVNGEDLWSEGSRAGRTQHTRILAMASGDDSGLLKTRNDWLAKDGSLIAHDIRTLTFYPPQGPDRHFDFEITIHASNGEIVLGDTKEGTFAIRVAESMRIKQPRGREAHGRLINSQGVEGGATWGKRAEWVDYSGPVEGRTLGVAIFDHPTNPRHPTWWHVRDYGLFAANPFGVHDFERKEKGVGDLKLSAGESITFRYRVLLHVGDEKVGRVAERYAEFTKSAGE